MASGLSITSPTQLYRRIVQADQYEEEGLTSLPSSPPRETSQSEQSYEPRPLHGYDVGFAEQTQNTAFDSRASVGRTPPIACKTPAPSRPFNPKAASGRSTKSHLTSTPANFPYNQQTILERFQSDRHDAQIQHEEAEFEHTSHNIPLTQVYGVESPGASRIVEDEAAQSLRERMIIMSTSGSETEAQRKPKTSNSSAATTTRPEDFRSPRSRLSNEDSDEESFASKRSLGDCDFSELDDFASGIDLALPHVQDPSALTAPFNGSSSAQPRSATSPAPSNKSSSQSTLIGKSPEPDERSTSGHHLPYPQEPKEIQQDHSTRSHLSSPGVGRRDSPQHHASYSFDGLHHSDSRELSSQMRIDPNDSLYNPTTQPRFEDIATHDKPPRTPMAAAASHKRTDIVQRTTISLSNMKAVHPTTILRSAKRTHVPRRLTEAADETSELSIPRGPAASQNVIPDSGLGPDVTLESDSTMHDLTTHLLSRHANGNTSVPNADASQRFNGTKLNSFLHSLNTRLTEENQTLSHSLAIAHEEIQRLKQENNQIQQQASSLDSRGPRTLNQRESADRTSRPDSQEMYAELQMLRNLIHEQESEIQQLRQHAPEPPESDASRDDLLDEIHDLKEDLDRLSADVQRKDGEIDRLRSNRLSAEGQDEHNAQLQDELTKLRAYLDEREEKFAEALAIHNAAKTGFTEKIASLKMDLAPMIAAQDDKIISTTADLKKMQRLADARDQELQQLKVQSESTLAQYEEEICSLKSDNAELEQLLQGRDRGLLGKSHERRINLLQKHVDQLQDTLAQTEKAAKDASFGATRLVEGQRAEIGRLQKRVQELESTFDQTGVGLTDSHCKIYDLEQALMKSNCAYDDQTFELVKVRADLDLAQTACTTQATTIQNLESRLAQALKRTFAHSGHAAPTPQRKIFHSSHSNSPDHEDLSEAYEEIQRLNAQLATPGEKADCEILNLKIKSLEVHRDQLEERVRILRQQASALVSSPGRTPGHSHLFKSIVGLRTPKMPNQMLASMTTTFANDASLSDNTITPMLSQIHELEEQAGRLRRELAQANEAVDEKLSKLAEANEGALGLSAELRQSESRVRELETRLDKLVGSQGTINKVKTRLADIQCPTCECHFDGNQIIRFRVLPDIYSLDVSMLSTGGWASGDPDDHTADSNANFATKKDVRTNGIIQQLRRDLETESNKVEELLAKHEVDQKDLAQLRAELDEAKEELDKMVGSLDDEEVRHRQTRSDREKVVQEKERLEQRLRKIENELSSAIAARDCNDAELRALQNVKGDTDNLSKELAKVQALANSLEYRNNDLENQQCDSEGQIEELTTEIGRRTERLAALEKSSLRLQKNVDEQHQELIDLREALELKSAEIIRLRDLKDDVLQQAENLRDDLLQVRGEAAQLAHDLHSFKEQQQLQQSTARSSDREADKLREELMARTKQLAKLTAKQENHVCTVDPHPSTISDPKKHAAESKGLLLRIRFLKLLFTRESYFRADLAVQKRMLLIKLGQTEIRNEAIQLALQKFGLPCEYTGRESASFTIHSRERSFRGVALAVRAVCRIRILSKRWKEEERAKHKLKEAYKKVRGKEFES